MLDGWMDVILDSSLPPIHPSFLTHPIVSANNVGSSCKISPETIPLTYQHHPDLSHGTSLPASTLATQVLSSTEKADAKSKSNSVTPLLKTLKSGVLVYMGDDKELIKMCLHCQRNMLRKSLLV